MKLISLAILFAGLGAHATTMNEMRAALASGQDPYTVLKNLYDTSAQAGIADFDLFGQKSDRHCAGVAAVGGTVGTATAFKRYAIAKPARGPLFPARTEYKLLQELFDKTSPLHEDYYDREENLKINLEGQTLSQTAREFVDHIKVDAPPAMNAVDVTASFRKSGDLLAMKASASGVDQYFYCWREPVVGGSASVSAPVPAPSHAETPFEILQGLYNGPSMPAQKSDFDVFGAKSNMQCAEATANADLEFTPAMKLFKQLKPSQGPLFPASERDLLVPESFDKASGKYNPANDAHDLRDLADQLTMTSTATELVVAGQRYFPGEWKTVTYSFRKADKYLVEKSEIAKQTTYIYCWR